LKKRVWAHVRLALGWKTDGVGLAAHFLRLAAKATPTQIVAEYEEFVGLGTEHGAGYVVAEFDGHWLNAARAEMPASCR
jgi:hypothetical protein